MQRRNITDLIKNAIGTVFLLAGAFFVCSTLVSMRAVFADPIAPVATPVAAASTSPRASASPRAGASRTTTATARPTASASRAATSRPSVANGTANAVASRSVSSRANTARTATNAATAPSRAGTTSASRATTSRGTATRTGAANTASRTTAATTSTRNVTARTGTTARVAANNAGRTVAARSGTSTDARVSLQGAALRGSKTNNSSLTYLNNKLYTGNYSNIIDSTTGLISADAYNNCMESYYACMDEICTARNAAQRRCACAGRVKAFADAEAKLESANEELITVSGQLALLIATKGKDISAALQLTDAEKVMNCVSWKETIDQYGQSSDQAKEWCTNHGIFNNGQQVTTCEAPSYCKETGNNFGFSLDNIQGGSSDILAQLKSWADAKETTMTILKNDDDSLTTAFKDLNNVVGNLAGINGSYNGAASSSPDALASTWGYDLFQYAHNNVCNRVLDSCFNGIYEACGTPPSGSFTNGQRKCGNGAAQCPFNYSSYVNVKTDSATGGDLDFITSTTSSGSVSNSATCFGYTSVSGDPYNTLRGPVADARRSIMQKYALDANADCDVYGEQLRTTAQNIGYQKVAAQQALQQKRLEFAQEEEKTIAAEYKTASTNFSKCLDEIYDCYNTQDNNNKSWSTSRIKTYCTQVSNAPSCYDTMICGAPNSSLQAVITKTPADTSGKSGDKIACTNTSDYKTNTCRNVVTISEVLSASYTADADAGSPAALREACLQNYGIDGIRNWASSQSDTGWSAQSCDKGQHLEGNSCVPDTKSCSHSDANAASAIQKWNASTQSWGGCTIQSCNEGYGLQNGACIQKSDE